MNTYTRREFTQLVGAAGIGGTGVLNATTTQKSQPSEWKKVDSPTNKTLHGVVDTVEGPFAVGASGDVLARRQNGWEKVVNYGPLARSRILTSVDVTDDRKAVWFVGEGGVVGEYRVDTETLTNYSNPKELTSGLGGFAVEGTAGKNERLYLATSSGELLVGVRQDSGAMKYGNFVKPGEGSELSSVDFSDRKKGHLCSTSQFVGETIDGGSTWSQIGIDFANASFSDIASVGLKDVNVAANEGVIFRYDGFRWTPHVVDNGRENIQAISRNGEAGLAAGNGGKVYERQSAGQWKRYNTSVELDLLGAATGLHGIDVAVGNEGTIVERRRADRGSGGNQTNTSMIGAGSPALPASSKTVRMYREGNWVR